MSQLQSIITFADSGTNSAVNAARLNSHVNDATLTNGAVISQIEQTTPLSADTLLLGDSTAAATGVPKKVQIGNLLLQSQRDGTQRWGGTAGGTANAITITTSPASSGAYVAGEIVRFITSAGNSGAVTINVDGRGVKNLYNNVPQALVSGDLTAGELIEAVYDGTQFQIVGQMLRANFVTAANTAENLRMNINQYAADSGSANAYACAPSPAATAYTAGMVVRLKAANTNSGASTVNVNSLGAKTIKCVVAGAVADLKANDIQANDVLTLVYDGTYFQLAGRVRSWDFVSTGNALAVAVSVAHGLGATPTKVRAVLVCGTTDLGYAVGDVVEIMQSAAQSTWSNATNVGVALASTTPTIVQKAGTTASAITAARWSITLYASL